MSMNNTEKKYAVKRVEEEYYSLLQLVRPKHDVNVTTDILKDLFKRGVIKLPSNKEIPDMLDHSYRRGFNHFFVGYTEWIDHARLLHEIDKKRFLMYEHKLKIELNTIKDEIMLAKECDLSKLFNRLLKIKL